MIASVLLLWYHLLVHKRVDANPAETVDAATLACIRPTEPVVTAAPANPELTTEETTGVELRPQLQSKPH